MDSKRFIIGDVLGFGWQVMTRNFWFFVGLGLVVFVLSSAPGLLGISVRFGRPSRAAVLFVNQISNLISLAISTMVGVGVTKIALKFCDGHKPRFGLFFEFTDCFWRYLGGHLLFMLIISVPILVLGVPPMVAVILTHAEPSVFLFAVPMWIACAVWAAIWAIKFSLWSYFIPVLVPV